MLIRSMTGYGRAVIKGKNISGSVEIKSVNHKYCEINVSLPQPLYPLEHKIKNLIKSLISRGKIDVSVNLNGKIVRDGKIEMNEKLIKKYMALIKNIQKKLNLKGEIKINNVLRFPAVMNYSEPLINANLYWDSLRQAFQKALNSLVQMREKEGNNIGKDIKDRIDILGKILENIEKSAKFNKSDYFQRMQRNIKEIAKDVKADKNRIELEIALLAEKRDISEEIVRAKSHLDQFYSLIKTGGSVGKKIDFLLQEIFREINTIGAKANGFGVSKEVIEFKNELERIREQVQNIE